VKIALALWLLRYRPDLSSVVGIELSIGVIAMNRLGVTLAALSSLIATPILAADLAVKAPPPPPPPPATWTSCYVGVEAGYGWGRIQDGVTYLPPAPFFVGVLPYSATGTYSGAMGGPQVGCDYQWGNAWVVGVVATYDFADISGSVHTNPIPNTLGVAAGTGHTFSEEIDGFGTVRGRIGWLMTPSWLIYGSGGLAYGRIVTSAETNGAASVLADSGVTWKTGWTAGGGVEWKFTDHISAFAEYLYAQLGSVNGTEIGNNGVPAGNVITDDYGRTKVNVVKAGINWRFP
jgi:outer membrane immunogenic protein